MSIEVVNPVKNALIKIKKLYGRDYSSFYAGYRMYTLKLLLLQIRGKVKVKVKQANVRKCIQFYELLKSFNVLDRNIRVYAYGERLPLDILYELPKDTMLTITATITDEALLDKIFTEIFNLDYNVIREIKEEIKNLQKQKPFPKLILF